MCDSVHWTRMMCWAATAAPVAVVSVERIPQSHQLIRARHLKTEISGITIRHIYSMIDCSITDRILNIKKQYRSMQVYIYNYSGI